MTLMILLQCVTNDQASNYTLTDFYPDAKNMVPLVAAVPVKAVLSYFSGILGTCQIGSALIHAGRVSGLQAYWTTIPILFYLGSFWIMYSMTEWAWTQPGYALILVFPAFCLINSKQIVCNFTKMDMATIPGSFFWFALFPLNRYAISLLPCLESYATASMSDGTPLLVPEKCVAATIFIVTLFWYVLWCVRTINQICDFLNIHCLSIKSQQ